jgi:hypothetical protein
MTSEIVAYVCSHIFSNTMPILLVSRAEGDWQCLCGQTHSKDEIPKVVGLNHLLERDPSLSQLRDLPVDWEAERASILDQWIRTELRSRN